MECERKEMTQEIVIFEEWRKKERFDSDSGNQMLGVRLNNKINDYLMAHRGHRIKSVEYVIIPHLTISKPHHDIQRSALVVFDVIKELEI